MSTAPHAAMMMMIGQMIIMMMECTDYAALKNPTNCKPTQNCGQDFYRIKFGDIWVFSLNLLITLERLIVIFC